MEPLPLPTGVQKLRPPLKPDSVVKRREGTVTTSAKSRFIA